MFISLILQNSQFLKSGCLLATSFPPAFSCHHFPALWTRPVFRHSWGWTPARRQSLNLCSSCTAATCPSWPEQRLATKRASVWEDGKCLILSSTTFLHKQWANTRREYAELQAGTGYGGSVTQAGHLAGWPAGKAYLQEGCEESTFGKGRGCRAAVLSRGTPVPIAHGLFCSVFGRVVKQ